MYCTFSLGWYFSHFWAWLLICLLSRVDITSVKASQLPQPSKTMADSNRDFSVSVHAPPFLGCSCSLMPAVLFLVKGLDAAMTAIVDVPPWWYFTVKKKWWYLSVVPWWYHTTKWWYGLWAQKIKPLFSAILVCLTMFYRPPALGRDSYWDNIWWYHSDQKIILLLTGSAIYNRPSMIKGPCYLMITQSKWDTTWCISQRH